MKTTVAETRRDWDAIKRDENDVTAHAAADDLAIKVLRSIAEGECEDPKQCALLAALACEVGFRPMEREQEVTPEQRSQYRQERAKVKANLRPHAEAIRKSERLTAADYGIVVT